MNIFQAIHGVMDEVGAIGKNRKNQQQGFMYRGVDEVMNALQPAFVKYHIFVVPEVLEQTREERTTAKGAQLLYSILKIKFTFYAEDGSNVSATVVGEGMDSADKASNKAMSVAFKYACFQVFCIPTEEMVDPDSETPPQSARGATPKPINQAYDNSKPAQHTYASSQEDVQTRSKQISQLIEGSSLTMSMVGTWIAKKYGNAIPVDELTENQFHELIAALSTAVAKERGGGN